MASERSPDPAELSTRPRRQRALAAFVGVLGALALLTPLRAAMWPETRVGGLLIAGALVEIFHGFRRSNADAQRSAWYSGGVSLLMGILLVNAPALTGRALTLFLAGWFALDGLRSLASALRSPGDVRSRAFLAVPGIVNVALALGIVLLPRLGVAWTVSIAGAMRLFAAASDMLVAAPLTGREAGGTAVSDLGFEDRADLGDIAERVEREEAA